MASLAAEIQPFIITDTPYQRPGRISRFVKKLQAHQRRIFLSVMILVLFLLATVFVLVLVYWPAACTPADPALPGLAIPQLGDIPRLFSLHPEYTGPSTPASDALWHAMTPQGKGFVSLAKLRAADALPDSIAALDAHHAGTLCVSAFHQLHCLDMLRHAVYAALAGQPVRTSHVAHCFDYLRQAVVCAADAALEAPAVMQGRLGVDGWGDTHRCRDMGALFDWAERFAFGGAGAGGNGSRNGSVV